MGFQKLCFKRGFGRILSFRREIIIKRTSFDLKAVSEARAHILEGLKKALEHIDEIIS